MYGALLPRNPARRRQRRPRADDLDRHRDTDRADGEIITRPATKVTIDGVEMVFQMTPGTEAPAEMNTFFPQFKAMWMAENATQHVAQHPDAARRTGARPAELGELSRRDHRPLRRRAPRSSSRATTGRCGATQKIVDYLEEAARSLQVHARPVGAADERGLHRRRDLQHDPAAAGARPSTGPTAATTAR